MKNLGSEIDLRTSYPRLCRLPCGKARPEARPYRSDLAPTLSRGFAAVLLTRKRIHFTAANHLPGGFAGNQTEA
jgi:hypothetical protein